MKSTAQSKQKKQKTQLDKANEALIELSVNVTAEDRKVAEKKCKVSRFTIGSYLAGKAKDLDIAMDLLQFFGERIEDRDQVLSKSA